MNKEDIIRMYEKANGWSPEGFDKTVEELERFAALVAAAERKRIESRPWGAGEEWIARAVAAEREACAEVAEAWQLGIDDPQYQTDCATAIRARGQND
jgi:hypothetical protein